MIFIRPLLSADVINILVSTIFGIKRAPECIKLQHFEGEHAKIFLGRPHPHWGGRYASSPDPTPAVGAFGVPTVDPLQTRFLDTGRDIDSATRRIKC